MGYPLFALGKNNQIIYFDLIAAVFKCGLILKALEDTW